MRAYTGRPVSLAMSAAGSSGRANVAAHVSASPTRRPRALGMHAIISTPFTALA